MTQTGTLLGPLERTGGLWVVGDSGRPDNDWVEFRPEGMHRHEPGGPGRSVAWSRLMPGVKLTLGGENPARGQYGVAGLLGGLPGPWRHGSGYLHLTLRDPYEDWVARFSRHPRHYPATGILLFGELMKRLLDESRAHLLGDPALLDRVVGRLATERLRGRHATQDAVTRALAPEDPAHADPASADPAPGRQSPGKQSPEK
ncbi:hypothetical protein CF54_39190 [Streptomyces sp. Tu 6176]|uniref:hypothetical protein n=1 Tax=Streptomyces sp. Tu 6176 TaxID=1470557 RepID=UPI000447C2D5|nr:hypothetical protein [Streptomyces sp. Tu 6176]EYT78116.1 hypothetical protein CF54_39190 [Streptomyces sp. Tu 6176]